VLVFSGLMIFVTTESGISLPVHINFDLKKLKKKIKIKTLFYILLIILPGKLSLVKVLLIFNDSLIASDPESLIRDPV